MLTKLTTKPVIFRRHFFPKDSKLIGKFMCLIYHNRWEDVKDLSRARLDERQRKKKKKKKKKIEL